MKCNLNNSNKKNERQKDRRPSPVSVQTRRRSDVAVNASGTLGGWCPGRLGCRRPGAQGRSPQTPRLPPAVTSCPRDTSGGRCHSGWGCSEQLCGKNKIIRALNNSAIGTYWMYPFVSGGNKLFGRAPSGWWQREHLHHTDSCIVCRYSTRWQQVLTHHRGASVKLKS